MMKWRWNGGVERKAKLLGECWTFFNLHFPAPTMEAMSRIYACKTEKNLQIFGWCLQCKQSCLWATLSYFCLRKQGRKINAMRRVVFEKCIKKSSALSHVKCEEVSLQIEFTTLPPKTTTSLWKLDEKGIGETRKCGHRQIMHSITRRDEMWGGWSEKTVGGREWAAPLCQLIYELGEMVWQYIYFSTLLKRDFYLLRFKSEGQQKPGDVTLMQSDCKWLHGILL